MAAPYTIEPFAINLGPLPLTGFGLAVLLAFGIANVVTQRELTRRGHVAEAEATPDIVTAALLGTLVGATLYYVILTRDVAGIAIAAGYAVGRTGCWAVGDDYGKPWAGFLSVKFPHGAPPSTAENMVRQFGAQLPATMPPWEVVAVHPTQLYETALGFVMFAVLWRLRAHAHREGWLFGVYCVLAGLERFVIEFVRAKDDRFLGPISTAQVIALTITLVGVLVMWARRGRIPNGVDEIGRLHQITS
jgi:phosphatidylglycerol:prolipoprotein diacylglycerol transferase